jgi:ligand-binding sensor domain-containing protein
VGCDQSLNKFEKATESFQKYAVPLVTHISQDTSGVLWLATPSGLYGLDPVTGQMRSYSHDPSEPSSLSGNSVQFSGEDKRGRSWVANTKSIDEFDRGTGKVALHEASSGFSFYAVLPFRPS